MEIVFRFGHSVKYGSEPVFAILRPVSVDSPEHTAMVRVVLHAYNDAWMRPKKLYTRQPVLDITQYIDTF